MRASLVGEKHDARGYVKEHKNVLADIRRMLLELGKGSAEFSADVPDGYGQQQPGFNLPKDLTITLVSGYSVVMRHRIVVRWQELEESAVPAAAFQVPTTLAGALRLAAEQAEQIEQQQAQLQQQAPAVAFVERYVEAKNCLGVREVAKVLHVRPTAFVRRLIPDEARQTLCRSPARDARRESSQFGKRGLQAPTWGDEHQPTLTRPGNHEQRKRRQPVAGRRADHHSGSGPDDRRKAVHRCELAN
jgi:phage regulator Rha-like protein